MNNVSKSSNSNLSKAKKEKNDEFYTQLTDIEKELRHYKQHFKDKVVYCNCDDPEWSNFWIYFSRNFEHLGLKKLISTHFEKDKPSYKLEIQRDINKDNKVDHLDTIKTVLRQNGDFRSDECIELLKAADIVITNPPFSLFRQYIEVLEEHNKKYLIVGNMNAITYKETFKLIKDNKLWLGINNLKEFKGSDGVIKKFGNINWYTNLTHKKRNEEIILYKKYNEIDYIKYENYEAIEVSKVVNIPESYYGVMGVPITFLEKFNPEQFKIIGTSDRGGDGFIDHLYIEHKRRDAAVINGKGLYKRIFIQKINNKEAI